LRILLREAGWEATRALVEAADFISTSRITYVEAHASIAAAGRARRLTRSGTTRVRNAVEEAWRQLAVVEVTGSIASSAASASERHRLRALDAIHLASARVLSPGIVVASWDEHIRRAAQEAGLAVAP